jgi:aldehyde dehydrogenase (NAD+)
MKFFKALDLQKTMTGTSTGSSWRKSLKGKILPVTSPVDGSTFAHIHQTTSKDYIHVLRTAENARKPWQQIPAPKRGEIVRQIGDRFREFKRPMGTLISYETGKPLQEGLGEVQELIDICDFSVGQSRMLYGMTSVSEREQHRLFEQYHPLGIVAIITAFNFPLAVWGWNAMIAAICGDICLWKPSSKAPVTAIAAQKIVASVLKENTLPEGIFSLMVASRDPVGEQLLNDHKIPLVSFTGSVSAGRHAAATVGGRLGKTILELGGNNAIILTSSADLQVALPSVVFGAVGTAGQRCTTTRRLIVHEKIYKKVRKSLIQAYASLKVGSPLDEKNHMGPLIDQAAVTTFQKTIDIIKKQGGKLLYGGKTLKSKELGSKCYVQPSLVEVKKHLPIVMEETFAPILYIQKYSGDVHNAIILQNSVRQGLSSSIFTQDQKEAEIFLSCVGSDCGIANVNIGTSGAEIGGAFGGEKETGGGRESGSDAWKAYMRRQTVTSNYGDQPPLAQGVSFSIT